MAKKVANGNPWTVPVPPHQIKQALQGKWHITVTAIKPVPDTWFPDLHGKNILSPASGGGQQRPILAAAGGYVTVLDFCDEQLAKDRDAAQQYDLKIETVCAEMTNLSMFSDAQFDLIVHPVSNVFIPDIQPVWNEASRVLKQGGILISGFMNPVFYLFDEQLQENGILQVVYSIPYSDEEQLSHKQINTDTTIEFGHSLESQIQGQIDAGFVITGFYEDNFGGQKLLDSYCNSFIATKALKT